MFACPEDSFSHKEDLRPWLGPFSSGIVTKPVVGCHLSPQGYETARKCHGHQRPWHFRFLRVIRHSSSQGLFHSRCQC